MVVVDGKVAIQWFVRGLTNLPKYQEDLLMHLLIVSTPYTYHICNDLPKSCLIPR